MIGKCRGQGIQRRQGTGGIMKSPAFLLRHRKVATGQGDFRGSTVPLKGIRARVPEVEIGIESGGFVRENEGEAGQRFSIGVMEIAPRCGESSFGSQESAVGALRSDQGMVVQVNRHLGVGGVTGFQEILDHPLGESRISRHGSQIVGKER